MPGYYLCPIQNWTRTTLRIEAIKCFPCYVKVTFIHMSPPHMPTVNNVVNINLPGLTVNLATSRTKPHTYGLFWKNNRNRCCIYLAFDNAEQCGRHHHWMQTSIRNLDLHRREILETRRASRFERFAGHGQQHTSVDGVGGQSIASSITGGTGRFNETAGYIPDLNDILGPLPAVPDSAAHWSRRISGVSGIYEEILERSYADSLASVLVSPPAAGSGSSARERRKLSRVSVASGIYEVMRPPMQSIRYVLCVLTDICIKFITNCVLVKLCHHLRHRCHRDRVPSPIRRSSSSAPTPIPMRRRSRTAAVCTAFSISCI